MGFRCRKPPRVIQFAGYPCVWDMMECTYICDLWDSDHHKKGLYVSQITGQGCSLICSVLCYTPFSREQLSLPATPELSQRLTDRASLSPAGCDLWWFFIGVWAKDGARPVVTFSAPEPGSPNAPSLQPAFAENLIRCPCNELHSTIWN